MRRLRSGLQVRTLEPDVGNPTAGTRPDQAAALPSAFRAKYNPKAVDLTGSRPFALAWGKGVCLMVTCKPGDGQFMGARLAVYPAVDDFVPVVIGAVRDSDPGGLLVATNDLGTVVQGPPERVFAYVQEVFVRAAAGAGHVTAALHLAAGCPGESVAGEPAKARETPVPLPEAEFPVACHWSLYPLGRTDYMDVIEREIAKTLAASTVEASPSNYASRLDGTAAAIFSTLQEAFAAVRRVAPHTVIHATLSKGSPSVPHKTINVYESS